MQEATFYNANGRLNREQQVQQYSYLVRRQALTLAVKLPTHIVLDDLIQAGMIGLLDALDRYDESYGASFKTYAIQRIYGAMIDELRSSDWLPRSVRRSYREIEQAVTTLEQQLGRAPTEREIAARVNLSLSDYQRIIGEANDGLFATYIEEYEDEQTVSDVSQVKNFLEPDQATMANEFKELLTKSLKLLPQREQIILALYYQEHLNLKEIGAVMELTESRVSQLHSQALTRLRARIKNQSN